MSSPLAAKPSDGATTHAFSTARLAAARALVAGLVLVATWALVRRDTATWGAIRASAASAARAPGSRVAVLAMMKNEGGVLPEWLRHYSQQGVDAIILLDNGSTDPFDATPPPGGMTVEVLPAPARHAQAPQYTKIGLPRLVALGIDIVLVVDLDEFAFSKSPNATLADELRATFADAGVSQTCMPWTHFGSSGHVKQPPSVRRGFTWRAATLLVSESKAKKNQVKCAARVATVEALAKHRHTRRAGREVPPPPSLQLNHYGIQSFEWFMAVKATRGAADDARLEHFRDESYFRAYDAGCHAVEDTALAQIAVRLDAAGGGG